MAEHKTQNLLRLKVTANIINHLQKYEKYSRFLVSIKQRATFILIGYTEIHTVEDTHMDTNTCINGYHSGKLELTNEFLKETFIDKQHRF